MTGPCPFDPLDPDVLRDPYPAYARLRDEAPVVWCPPLRGWLVSRYADVAEVLANDTFHVSRRRRAERTGGRGPTSELAERMLLFVDPPDHTRLRSVISPGFSSRRLSALADRIDRTCQALLDRLPAGESVDWMACVARELPIRALSEILGVTTLEAAHLRARTGDLTRAFEPRAKAATSRAAARSLNELEAWLKALLRSGGSSGLIGDLVAAQRSGALADDREIVASVVLLLIAGNETTASLLGSAVWHLLADPLRRDQAREQPGALEKAIEESLRLESPIPLRDRFASADVELAGHRIEAGARVFAMVAAANRDPAVFRAPDVFDPERTEGPHLAFGWARHFCLGARLARLEARLALGSLLRRHPRARLAEPQPDWDATLFLRTPARLLVDLGRPA